MPSPAVPVTAPDAVIDTLPVALGPSWATVIPAPSPVAPACASIVTLLDVMPVSTSMPLPPPPVTAPVVVIDTAPDPWCRAKMPPLPPLTVAAVMSVSPVAL